MADSQSAEKGIGEIVEDFIVRQALADHHGIGHTMISGWDAWNTSFQAVTPNLPPVEVGDAVTVRVVLVNGRAKDVLIFNDMPQLASDPGVDQVAKRVISRLVRDTPLTKSPIPFIYKPPKD